ncbi:Hypothetical protein A7982_05128 [Minicystis rosea]|nr:Hypothetical protein A7982_05128 [Minicystis rosea]
MVVGIVSVTTELRRIRAQIRESDENQREHRQEMIGFAAEVLRTALDEGKGRVLVVEPKKANDNAGAGEEPGGEVIPLHKDRGPDPSKG